MSLASEGVRCLIAEGGRSLLGEFIGHTHPAQLLRNLYNWDMKFPVKRCVVCGEEFELKPGKPGFANRCPSCSNDEESTDADSKSADQWKTDKGANAARRDAMRNLLYRKDS